ncbi:MAG: ROK family protein [Spirochaetes bacterium]|nr:ROK family protein [Spirochaetota bacterium]
MIDNSGTAVGCDIGGTYCKIGLVEAPGKVKEQISFIVNHEAGVGPFLSTLLSSIETLISHEKMYPSGIGVLLPGYLKNNRKVPYIMVNIPMLEEVPLYDLINKRFNIPVKLDIDRNGPCLAEYKFKYRDRVKRLMYVTLGTGVGVGLVVNGEICRVTNDSIGELGHITIDVNGPLCVCGNRGCVETYVSKDGIARIANEMGILELSAKDENGLQLKGLDPNIIYYAAMAGNKSAMNIFKKFGLYLGAAAVNYANIYSPDMIIIGGGLSGASDFYLQETEEYLNNHWFERKDKKIIVRKTVFGSMAGIIGAASLIL